MKNKRTKIKSSTNKKTSASKSSLFSILWIIFAIITIIIIFVAISLFDKFNTSEQKYIDSLRTAHNTISKAFGIISNKNEINSNMTTEDFTKNVLTKYIKIAKTCTTPNDCGFTENIKRPDGTVIKLPHTMTTITKPDGLTGLTSEDNKSNISSTTNNTTKKYNDAYFFTTQNGFHVMFFYNPYCVNNAVERPYINYEPLQHIKIQKQLALDTVCFWGVYDMNGQKGPNRVGKDIGFVGSFYREQNTRFTSVLPGSSKAIATTDLTGGNNHAQRAIDYCKNLDNDKYKLPSVNELSLMYLNSKLISDDNENKWYWTNSEITKYDMQNVCFTNGHRTWMQKENPKHYVYCVKKMPQK